MLHLGLGRRIVAQLSISYVLSVDCYRSIRSLMFFKIGVLKNFANFPGKTFVLESLLNKKRLRHRWFLVEFAKFLRTLFLTEHLRRLLLLLLLYLLDITTLPPTFRSILVDHWF